MKAKESKRMWLPILILITVLALAVLFLNAWFHYSNSAKADDDEGLKALTAGYYLNVDSDKEIVEFRNIYKSNTDNVMAIQFVVRDRRHPNKQDSGWYFCLTPDKLFKNRYRIGGYGDYSGGENLNELVADSQTYYDSKLKKDIEFVTIRGVKLENIGVKFTIPELNYSGTITDEDYFDIIVIEDSNLARCFDIQFEN